MRFVLFGDGQWAVGCLEELVKLDYEPVLVVQRTKPSTPALAQAAEDLGIPAISPERVNAGEATRQIAALRPEMGICIAYNQIFKLPLISLPSVAFINCHAGLLPHYRGRNVINWAIINGEEHVGLTIHHIDEGIDTGDIILQESVQIDWTDTYGTVLSRVMGALPRMAGKAAIMLANGAAPRIRQAHLLGSYYGGRLPGDEDLDWSTSSLDIYNKIRGISAPGPGARTYVDGQAVSVWSAQYDARWPKYRSTPGEVVGREPIGIRVKTGDSTIVLNRVSSVSGQSVPPVFPVGTRFQKRGQ